MKTSFHSTERLKMNLTSPLMCYSFDRRLHVNITFRTTFLTIPIMGLEEDFQVAVDLVSNKINKTLSNEELLDVYALFKQASIGNCIIYPPSGDPWMLESQGWWRMDSKVSLDLLATS